MYFRKHDGVGFGSRGTIYHVSPGIVVKASHPSANDVSSEEEPPFIQEAKFYNRLNEQDDRCQHIIECFIALPDFLFLSYYSNDSLHRRFFNRQERGKTPSGFWGHLIRVTEYEDPALIARWIQQLTAAIGYVEKLGFCHNDIHPRNCLLDKNLNLKLIDFDRATPPGPLLEGSFAPWARKLIAGPLQNTYGLCSSQTEQFSVGTFLYYMVYGREPYEDINLLDKDPSEMSRRFSHLEFPELNRNEIFDFIISCCWHNTYPNMELAAQDIQSRTSEIALKPTYESINHIKGKRKCESLIREGLLGPDFALRYQPIYRKYLLRIWKTLTGWPSIADVLKKFRSSWMWTSYRLWPSSTAPEFFVNDKSD
ncbi:hypothetical protein LOZ12_005456 [Ophidiomyces ophidiicola]|uniref:uncharacterized protein n=1 Tax=Ophidiomyces ophidiicola TaxID=1387563 RepID=UPI0020C433E0|nr:uncharacterized protein LOZ57_001200 [Ophidiomyces ophidiicola]KAI1936451.1 hypothetical protein LOZ62_005680 [Ophidiomyces ophidiicola]KAI1951788.1 hypothetical protein LOZ57_001200 [Ophidiomyces ophidiicola]KAI2044464.1 hypothetical protein LOZ44_005051 [Ophidiomyces ophidiicola]KAI2047021.1 hypothetical protein LOZ38_005093 [Ophidiomyces ophidiicola]KAI2058625.1 hypothetical protein LOZ43_002547 [Ophidiomyces ophidiicola]